MANTQFNSNDPQDDDLVERILEDYLAQANRGENPDIELYCCEYPQCADELREIARTMDLANISVSTGLVSVPIGHETGELPEQIGDYKVLREIGRGGMGVVYEAEHKTLGRRVALKVLFQRHAHDGTAIERFHREARAIAKLHHTNIVPLFEVGSDDGQFFLAMQFIGGQSLDRVVDALKKMVDESAGERASAILLDDSSVSGIFGKNDDSSGSKKVFAANAAYAKYFKRIAVIGAQAAEALHHAHSRGIIHRDVKPSNLLLDEDGRVWLSDFGLAKTEDDAMTRTGDIVGTIRYMAPERLKGNCDERSDLYALGLTIYELLTLQRPFEDADQVEMLSRIANDAPVPPRTLRPQVPKDLETIVLKAIDKIPSRRYGSVNEFAADLLRFSRNESIQARRSSHIENCVRWAKRNPSLAASLTGIAALLLILVVGSIVVSWQQSILRAKAESNAESAEVAKGEAVEAMALAQQREVTRKRSQYFAEMNLAGQRIGQAGHLRELGRITERWKQESIPNLLGWEWHYLRAKSMDASVVFPDQSFDHAASAAWSPDGQRVVVAYGGDDSNASNSRFPAPTICDPNSGKVLHVLAGHHGPVTCVDWHPHGPLIATCSTDGSIRIWNADTGEFKHNVSPIRAKLTFVAWSPSGKRLACATRQGDVGSLFVLDTNEIPGPIKTIPPLHGSLPDFTTNRNLVWSPDETQVAATGSSGEYDQVRKTAIFDVKKVAVAREPFEAASIRWKPEGHELSHYITSKRSGEIIIWDAATQSEIGRLSGHTAQLFLFKFSPDGKSLATAGFDKTVRVWDLASKQTRRVFQEHPRNLNLIRWDRTGNRIVSGSWQKDTRVWQVADPRVAVIQTSGNAGEGSEILDIDWHPNGRWLAAAGPKVAGVWDVETRQLVDKQSKEVEGRWFGGCEWDRTGEQLAFYGAGTNIHKVDSDGKLEFSSRLRGWTHRLEWHPDGSQILAAANKDVNVVSNVEARSTHKWNETEKLASSGSRHAAIRWHPIHHSVFAVATDKMIRIVDRENGTHVELRGHTNEVLDLDWHPDGNQLLSASSDGTARIWSVATRETIHTLYGHNNLVNQVSWAPDGHRIATAGRDGTVKVWDPKSGAEILSLIDLKSAVKCVSWSPDGDKLAAAGLSGAIAIWDATLGHTD